ncbi:retrovirus-related pol polyprotein from transposon TNT 1-94 [Tanacetum coccineum]
MLISQIEYIVSIVNQQTHFVEFPQIDSGLAVPVFKQGDDPIDAINKMISFLSTIVTSHFPTTNNQLRNSFNPIQQAAIHEGRVTVQLCPKPKRKRDATWFRDKVLLVEAQGSGKVLNEEELEFLADPGVAEGPVIQTVITHNAAYQVDDLDPYDSDCDDFSTAKAVLMANLASYRSDVLSEYLLETQNAAVQDINSYAQQDAMILSVFEQLSNQVTNCNKVNKDNLISNESLSAELERYKERFADFEKEINSLKQTLSEQLKENELLTETFNVLKNESKEKETKNIDKEIVLEKKVKELDNIETNVISIADLEEILMLVEESRSKMLLKQSDPMLQTSHPNTDQSALSPIKIEAHRELPKVSLVNTSLKKLKYHLGQFDTVVKKWTTPDALTEGEWGFEHTKAVFLKEIIPFLKTLKDIFNVFDKDLLNEVTEVQTVSNQMEAAVQQSNHFSDIVNIVVNSSVNMITSVNVNSSAAMNDSVNYVENCNKCLELEAELIKQHNMVEKDEYNRLSKSFSKLEQHCISLKFAMQLNKENFQKNNTYVNPTEPTFDHLFELNNLKAELQAKDTTIEKLKANIKRLNKTSTTNSMKKDIDEIETINIELEHREKVFVITTLKNDLRKLKGKDIVDNVAQVSNATTVAPGLCKLDLVTLAPKDKNNRETHIYYLKHTMEQVAILREIVEQAKSLNPLDSASYSSCKYVKLIQELLGYVRDTCHDIHKPRVSRSTKSTRSKSTDNTKNDKILQISSSTQKKNKVEDHSRIVKSCLNKPNCVVEPPGNANVQHFKLNTNSELMCVKCNSSMFDDARHEMCFLEFVSDMNASSKSKSVKKAKKKEEWKPIGKVFTKIRYNLRPTGRTFTLVGNACPLTRITATNKVPFREPIPLEAVAQESVVTKVYTRRPKVVQIVLWYLNSGCSKHMTGDRSQLTNFVHKFLGTVKFGNDQIAKIMRYGDYQIGNITISRVYYVEGLGHNLFSVGQLCDSDLEVAFRKHTCFVRNLEGVDLLSGSWETNLYTLSIEDMMASSPICLLSKASKTKSWLWHRRLSHLNFGAINHLAKHGLVRGLPKLKFEKDHLCSACAMGKSKKQSHKPKSEDTNQEKLYLLHMDLCGPMRVASVNGKKYILVIVDDYSRFTWVKFLASKDEAPDFIIKFLKMIQVRLNATVRNIRT